MDCQKIIELLAIPPEDRTPEEERQIEEHLGDCRSCCAEEELLGRMDGLVSASLRAQAKQAGAVPAAAPVFNITTASSSFRRLAGLAIAAAVLFAVGTAALGFMLGTARTRVEMLEEHISTIDRRSAQLEQKMEKQSEQIRHLQEQKSAVPRTVNYYMFTPRQDSGTQPVSLPGFTGRQGEEYVKEWF